MRLLGLLNEPATKDGGTIVMAEIMDWLHSHENLLHQLGTLSLILLFVTVVVLSIAVAKLPEDYFEREKREPGSHLPRCRQKRRKIHHNEHDQIAASWPVN